ncbi:MAG: sugar phosphate nucleotidyltransferase [Candidatus Hodarchaeales archaeon]
MRCIIPAAGRGTRLRPHTHTKPKVLLSLANRPIISYILDDVIEANIKDIIIIVGYEKEKLIEYIKSEYQNKCNLTFIEQKERKGLGHAIHVTAKYLDGTPVLIALGDSLYETSFKKMIEETKEYPKWDGAITVKEVQNPQFYGVVTTKGDSLEVKELEEKPQNPKSSKVITGVYIFNDSRKLRDSLEKLVITNNLGKNDEIQLTDALQLMINNGGVLGTIHSGKWFDCGKKEALLLAHRYVLDAKNKDLIKSKLDNSIVIPPVAIEEGCIIENSIIGPYVSIDKGTKLDRAIITSSIIGSCSIIKNASIHDSLVGNKVELIGGLSDLNIGDHSKIQFSS